MVGVLFGRRSYSIWIYYDFADDQGGVTRDNASLRGEYWQPAAGSTIAVLYLPGNPSLNNHQHPSSPRLLWPAYRPDVGFQQEFTDSDVRVQHLLVCVIAMSIAVNGE